MALIVVAADKGAPGVTTTALALASVWPSPVLLAECDPLGEAATVVLVTRPDLGDVIRLRDRATAIVASAQRRGRRGISLGVIVITDPKNLKAAQAEVAHALHQAGLPVRLVCGMADDPKAAELLRGTWGGRLDKTLLLRTAREVAGQLVAEVAGPAPV